MRSCHKLLWNHQRSSHKFIWNHSKSSHKFLWYKLEEFTLIPLVQKIIPYETTFHILAIKFDSSVCFSHPLYSWKGLSGIYNLLVIWFDKFLTNYIHFLGLKYDTLLTTPKNMMPQLREKEPRTKLREAHMKSHF